MQQMQIDRFKPLQMPVDMTARIPDSSMAEFETRPSTETYRKVANVSLFDRCNRGEGRAAHR